MPDPIRHPVFDACFTGPNARSYPPDGQNYNPDLYRACIFVTITKPVIDVLTTLGSDRCTEAEFNIRDGYTFYFGNAPDFPKVAGQPATYDKQRPWIEKTGSGRETNIIVRKPFPVDFVFQPLPDQSFPRPIGIAFTSEGAQMTDAMRRGDKNIPLAGVELLAPGAYGGEDIDKPGIRIRNLHLAAGADGAVKWGFNIVFQAPDGKIGIIDPSIENESED